jgi:hypothetical protein
MPYHNIAHTHIEKKNTRKFWEEMYKEAQKIYDEYNDKKEDKFHREFYRRFHFEKEDFKKRPDFFEPVY